MNFDLMMTPQLPARPPAEPSQESQKREAYAKEKNDYSTAHETADERALDKASKLKKEAATHKSEKNSSFSDFMAFLTSKNKPQSINLETKPISTELSAEAKTTTEDDLLSAILNLEEQIALLLEEAQTNQLDQTQQNITETPDELRAALIAFINNLKGDIAPLTTPEELSTNGLTIKSLIILPKENTSGEEAPKDDLLAILGEILNIENSSWNALDIKAEKISDLQQRLRDFLTQNPDLLEKWQTELTPRTPEEEIALLAQFLEKFPDVAIPENKKSDAPLSRKILIGDETQVSRFDLRYRLNALGGENNTVEEISGYDFKQAMKDAGQEKPGASSLRLANDNALHKSNFPLPPLGLALENGSSQAGALIFDDALQPQIVATSQTATTANNAANLITQTQSAAAPHPATQLIIATIKKAAGNSENTNIKLQLDPPELGRVEVKMSLNKDNAAKVVLTVEKPETFLMLQRDAHMLERILQETGLNADGNLSFELAQDGSAFDQDNNRGGGHDQGGTGAGNNNDEQIIETVMNWTVDPVTGRMHYNVLV